MDPYYLTHKAETVGYHPEVILAGRRINDNMGRFIAEKTVKLLIRSNGSTGKRRVGVLGLTFKEDCPDLRNTRTVDVVAELESYGMSVLVHDPIADSREAERFFGRTLRSWDDLNDLDAVVIAVAHREYKEQSIASFSRLLAPGGCIIDVKSVLDPEEAQRSGLSIWRL